jgi:ABC-type oligopeptide transport system substrate-binding subunit
MPRPANFKPADRRIFVIASEARNLLFLFLASFLPYFLASCSHPLPFTGRDLTFLIEANPVNLDPRFATDGQSQLLDGLIFSGLLARDGQMNLHGDLASSWEMPDALTYVFHLKPNVKFQNGRLLTSADVKPISSSIPPTNRPSAALSARSKKSKPLIRKPLFSICGSLTLPSSSI